jgi:tetratricopeptide (TPR) repeat protein
VKETIHFLQIELPASIWNKPAVVATLAYIYHASGQVEEAVKTLKSTGDDQVVADFAMSRGKYEEAAALYEKAADGGKYPVHTARLVKALSYTEPDKAFYLLSAISEQVEFPDE